MAFTKTSSPIWYIDDTYANVAAELKSERVFPNDILCAIASQTGGNIVLFVRKGGPGG